MAALSSSSSRRPTAAPDLLGVVSEKSSIGAEPAAYDESASSSSTLPLPKITADNVLVRFRGGSYDKWLQKAQEFEKERLEKKLENLDDAVLRNVRSSQVGYTYVVHELSLTFIKK